MSQPLATKTIYTESALCDQECERIARPIGSGFRYACLHLTAEQRRAASAIKALDLTLDDIRREVAEPHVARAKLDWWNHALYQLTQESAAKADTPITQALTTALAELDIPLSALVPALENRLGGAELELDYQGFESDTDMSAYLDATGGAIFELYARLLQQPEQHMPLWRKIGAQHQRITRLQYLGRDIRSGFIYLPQALMSHHGIDDAQLFRPDAAEQLQPLLHAELDSLIADRNAAIEALANETPRPPRFLRSMIAIDHARIRQLRASGVAVLERREELSPLRHLITAWWAGKRPIRPLR